MKLRERVRRWRKPALSEEEREERLQAMTNLAAVLRDGIRRRFPEIAMEFPEAGTLVPAPWKGDLGEELVVSIPCPSGGSET